jgi:hypothetical protein
MVREPSTIVLTAVTVISRRDRDAIQTIADDCWQLPKGITVADCKKTPVNSRRYVKVADEFGTFKKPYL